MIHKQIVIYAWKCDCQSAVKKQIANTVPGFEAHAHPQGLFRVEFVDYYDFHF